MLTEEGCKPSRGLSCSYVISVHYSKYMVAALKFSNSFEILLTFFFNKEKKEIFKFFIVIYFNLIS